MFTVIQKSLRIQLIVLSMLVEALMLALLLGNSIRLINIAIDDQTNLRIQAAEPLLNAATSVPLMERDYATLSNMLEELHKNKKHNFDYIVILDEANNIYTQVGVYGNFPLDGSYVSPHEYIVNRSSDISLSGEIIGHIYYGLSRASFMQTKDKLLRQSVVIAIVELLLSFVLLMMTGYYLTRNLDNLMQQVVQNEKMSALGSLVAGIAHEINTPVGVSLTGITLIQKQTKDILKDISEDCLTKTDLIAYLETMRDASKTMYFSLENAAELIRSFKQIAVDQNMEEKRNFNLNAYTHNVISSLQSELKNINIINEIDKNIECMSYAGIFAQIFSNLIINSMRHAFDNDGTIIIQGYLDSTSVIINYIDDGKGMGQDTLDKMFNPFFTTKMGQGGSGLGLSIIYNLIQHKLKGKITCESTLGQGMHIAIIIPRTEIE
ncbi:HAMP domain-containing histidine kinase [Sulfurimonas sp. MAG313]|nr:HAMP domain-containing sensor histidine kinase [Sulfurimonas sp. MAG313]MDF1882266.1 HAMP domain-containing histidine kinase [Sulfurimonas sp. MAG313]